MRRKLLGLIVLAIGGMMLARTLGYTEFDWFFDADWKKFIIPGVILLVGLRLLFSSSSNSHSNGMKLCEVPETQDGESMKISTAFSGNAYNFRGEDFNGAKIDAFMGGVSIDLSEALIQEGATIDISTFMGGADIRVPKDVNVLVQSSCLLGGVNDKTYHSVTPSVSLLVKASCFLGGVELKN